MDARLCCGDGGHGQPILVGDSESVNADGIEEPHGQRIGGVHSVDVELFRPVSSIIQK